LAALFLEFPPLVWTGRISYGLYLYHIPIIHWLRPGGIGPDHAANTLLAVGLTLAAALVSYFCIERPCLRWKNRLGRAVPSNRRRKLAA
jgi:peptidoglycan/LPS O-acetylase OafA/YrhL